MAFRDRSPLRNGGGGRFRPGLDTRPGPPNFGPPGRPGAPRLDNRGPRPDWRDRERFDDLRQGPGFRGGFGGRGPEFPPGGPPPFGPGDRGAPGDLLRGGPPLDGRPDLRDVRIAPKDGFGPRGGPLERDGIPPGGLKVWDERLASGPGAASMGSSSGPGPVAGRTNDCEIIVTHKSLTDYAEFIERRLKKLGLSADLLFPNEEVPLGRVLANIANRGSLYAIIITQLNEEHRSITVNILHGNTQEHRNVSIEDGLQLISRNFEAFGRGEKPSATPAAGGVAVNAAGIPLLGKHPDVIQSLLIMLIDNKPLTALQYEKLIQYLQEKKDAQLKMEIGEGLPVVSESQVQAQLQNRILDILKSSDVSQSQDRMSSTFPPGPPRSYGAPPFGGRK